MRLKTVSAANITEGDFHPRGGDMVGSGQGKEKQKDNGSKGITLGVTPGFILIAIVGITVFSFFYWNKLGYSRELIARTAADRMTRSIKLVSTYEGQGSLEISFRRSYKFKVAEDRVVATYRGRNSTSYFFTSSKVEPPPMRKETKSVKLTKQGKEGNITVDYPG